MARNAFASFVLLLVIVLESSAREPHKQLPATPVVEDKIVRARDLGIPFEGKPGKFNAITDVAGVEVGYTTLISGEATEEAIVNALVDNQTMTGRDNHRVDALPQDRMRSLLRKYNRLP